MAKRKYKKVCRISDDKFLRYALRRSFISGVGSTIAVSGTSRLPRRLSPSRDYVSIKSDWCNVGGYLDRAVVAFEAQTSDCKFYE